jgi:hypothetical protein
MTNLPQSEADGLLHTELSDGSTVIRVGLVVEAGSSTLPRRYTTRRPHARNGFNRDLHAGAVGGTVHLLTEAQVLAMLPDGGTK